MNPIPELNNLQWIALIWFAACWVAYNHYSGLNSQHGQRIQEALQYYIDNWIGELQYRDNRITDVSIITNLERNTTFFASSSLLIIAGLMTAAGSSEKAILFLKNLPFVHPLNAQVWELGILLMLGVFAYAFFTFTWSMRQWGFASILVGGAAMPDEHESIDHNAHRQAALSRIILLAVYHFNLGLRAYYFSLALIAWFLHPVLFILSTTWVVAVLYRREFHSRTLKALLINCKPS